MKIMRQLNLDLGCCLDRTTAQSIICVVQEEFERGNIVGLDVSTGEAFDPKMEGVYDNYIVKKQIIQSAPVVAGQLLLVDEVMRAGINMRSK